MNFLNKRVLKTQNNGFYEIRTELVDGSQFGCEDLETESAYSTKDGGYIGDAKEAKRLNKKYGIEIFEKASSENNVVSVGFAPKEQKWYGWSHRAIAGFGINDEAFECFPEGNKKGKKIKTLEQAKEAAKKFAESVS